MQTDIELALDDEMYLSELAREVSDKYDKVTSGDDIRKAALGMVERARTRGALKNAFLHNLHQIANTLARTLVKKSWQVWYAPEGYEFVTSDNPLISFRIFQEEQLPLALGEGFAKDGVIAAFPLAPTACLIIGPAGSSRTVDERTVAKVNEAIIRLCGRYVYSRTFSKDIQGAVDRYAGGIRYGINAFLSPDPKVPDVGRIYLLRLLGLES
jgi:hypothetical protein